MTQLIRLQSISQLRPRWTWNWRRKLQDGYIARKRKNLEVKPLQILKFKYSQRHSNKNNDKEPWWHKNQENARKFPMAHKPSKYTEAKENDKGSTWKSRRYTKIAKRQKTLSLTHDKSDISQLKLGRLTLMHHFFGTEKWPLNWKGQVARIPW